MEKSCKVLLIGPFPPPITGQSISLKMLVESLKSNNVIHRHLSTTPKNSHITGKLSFGRAYETCLLLINFLKLLISFKPDVIYLTKGSSLFGFLRDFAICACLPSKSKFVVHLKGGNYDSFYENSSKVTQFMIRSFLKRANVIIVLGSSLVKMYDFEPLCKSKIQVVHNCLPFENKDLPKKFPRNKKVEILYLSNLIESKGYFDILVAAKDLLENNLIDFHITHTKIISISLMDVVMPQHLKRMLID